MNSFSNHEARNGEYKEYPSGIQLLFQPALPLLMPHDTYHLPSNIINLGGKP